MASSQLKNNIMRSFILILFYLIVFDVSSQTILNGDFENNLATSDIINLSNEDCNLKIKDINSFGSYGDIDILNSTTYGGGGAQNGKWYIGMTGGSTDIIALKLSSPLTIGLSYKFSFYARRPDHYKVYPIQIGISSTHNNTGITVYTSTILEEENKWTQYTFTFTSTSAASYITVQMKEGNLYDWINLDNFTLGPNKCAEYLTLLTSAETITEGSTATFSVLGASNYRWSDYETLAFLCNDVVSAKPGKSTIYTVTSHQKDCPVLTATVQLTVTKPEQFHKDTIIAEKKDTILPQTITSKNKKKRFHSHRVNGRRFNIQENLTVANSKVKIVVWDKNRVDGDRVSLYLNGVLLEEDFVVTKTKKEISIELEPGKNIIVLHALNLGKIPPNTSAMSISDGSKAKIVTIVSDLKKSGALEIIYDPLVLNK